MFLGRGIGWAVIVAGTALAQDRTVADEIPLVHPVSGKAFVWRAAGDRLEALEKPSRVAPSDRLGTLLGTPAQFSADGSLLVLLKNIRVAREKGLALERKADRLVLRVYEGTVVVESYEAQVDLETPHGRVSGKQVYFIVSVEDGATRVATLEGKVTFANDLGSSVVTEGTSSRAEAGKGPSGARPDPIPEADWMRAVEAETNLLRNPGFEAGLEDWPADANLDVREDREVFRGGRRSCRCRFKDVTPSNPVFSVKTARGVLAPGARYLLRFFVRTEGLLRDGKPAALKLVLDREGKGSWADNRHHFVVAASEGAWAARRVLFDATSPDCCFSLHAAMEPGLTGGTVWLDDFYLGRLPGRR
jgi:hypothetical protein